MNPKYMRWGWTSESWGPAGWKLLCEGGQRRQRSGWWAWKERTHGIWRVLLENPVVSLRTTEKYVEGYPTYEWVRLWFAESWSSPAPVVFLPGWDLYWGETALVRFEVEQDRDKEVEKGRPRETGPSWGLRKQQAGLCTGSTAEGIPWSEDKLPWTLLLSLVKKKKKWKPHKKWAIKCTKAKSQTQLWSEKEEQSNIPTMTGKKTDRVSHAHSKYNKGH